MPIPCALLLSCPASHLPRARYIFQTWASRYDVALLPIDRLGDLPAGHHLLTYGQPVAELTPSGHVPHLHVEYRRELADEAPDPGRARWVDHGGRPVLDMAGDVEAPIIEASPTGLTVHSDIVSAAYHLLSGAPEQRVRRLDHHGRVPHDETLVGRLGIVHRPVVDEWFGLLAEGLAHLSGGPVPRRDLWNGAPFAVCITHDIDRVHRGWVDAVRRLAREARAGRWASAFEVSRKVLRRLASGRDFYGNLDELARLDVRYAARATFFFLASADDPLDADYRLVGCRWERAIRRLRDAGGEIGLHGSYRSYADGAVLARERQALERIAGQPVVGVRQHFLRFDPARTWQAQAQAGFRYDATVGFVEQIGFRAGTSFPYAALDCQTNRPLPLLEIPLVAMDRTLEGYLGLSPERAWGVLEPVLRTVERSGGCLGLLWHNLFVVDACFPGWRSLYERVLDWARGRGAWLAAGEDVCRRFQ